MIVAPSPQKNEMYFKNFFEHRRRWFDTETNLAVLRNSKVSIGADVKRKFHPFPHRHHNFLVTMNSSIPRPGVATGVRVVCFRVWHRTASLALKSAQFAVWQTIGNRVNAIEEIVWRQNHSNRPFIVSFQRIDAWGCPSLLPELIPHRAYLEMSFRDSADLTINKEMTLEEERALKKCWQQLSFTMIIVLNHFPTSINLSTIRISLGGVSTVPELHFENVCLTESTGR